VKSPAAADSSAAAKEFDRRAARAELLAAESAAASDPLRFAAGLYRVQSAVAGAIEAAASSGGLTGHLDRDLSALEPAIPAVLEFAVLSGPAPLAAEAEGRLEDDSSTRHGRLLTFWEGGTGSGDDYLSRAILRPYVETLRVFVRAPARVHRRGGCPFCGAPPAIAARRDAGALEGARRMLACLLCGSEWLFQRILCPSCFEEDPVKLPNFQSDRHPSVRIEACETCRRYVKSLDLSLDARPIPEVDDLVSLSLDLWAAEEGFSRIEPGLAGL
jgi:FdhE protein